MEYIKSSGENPLPSRCLCIHALDGYETYKVDDHTIGVRPIWISVKDKLPLPYDWVLVFASTNGTNEPNPMTLARLIPGHTIWEFLYEYADTSGAGVYQDLEWPVKMDEITHWMPLPNPPELPL